MLNDTDSQQIEWLRQPLLNVKSLKGKFRNAMWKFSSYMLKRYVPRYNWQNIFFFADKSYKAAIEEIGG